MQFVHNKASSGWFLWARSSKKGEFRRFTVTIMASRVSRVSRVRVGVRISVKIKVSLVLIIMAGIGLTDVE